MSSFESRHRVSVALTLLLAIPGWAHSQVKEEIENRMSTTATGSFEVKLEPQTFEGQPEGSSLARMSIDKTLSGDLQATTRGQMLSAMSGIEGSAGYVAIERVEGTLHGKQGSFVLLHRGVMNRGAPTLSVTVVPDSGTGELEGLSGDFDILIEDGSHRYSFVYSLPGE